MSVVTKKREKSKNPIHTNPLTPSMAFCGIQYFFKVSSTQTCYQTQFVIPILVLWSPNLSETAFVGLKSPEVATLPAALSESRGAFSTSSVETLPSCRVTPHLLFWQPRPALTQPQHSPFPGAAAQAQPRRSRFSHQHNWATDIPTGKKSLWCCCQISKQLKLKQVSSSPTFSSLPTGIRGDDLLNKGSEFNYSSLDQFLPTNTLTTATENVRLVLGYCFDF